ncbi:hypothetical protein NDU88_005604 [Pleurodeles waltl]|uniref:Uncharacterized protein n=1 Tax=Pleurodeles waltl TaxID=8319 RepID=A0AAV7MX91_PLEWA|nr:hypothetical protein NDU88_005604 [Pleurodeles waltl]
MGWGRCGKEVKVGQEKFGLGVEKEFVVVGGVRLLTLGEDTLGEDTGDVWMVVGVVTARERGVVVCVPVMAVVAVDVVHAGVSVDETGREEGDEEEGDTVEAVDVGVSACV